MNGFWPVVAYATHFLSLATFVMTLFINTVLAKISEHKDETLSNSPKVKTVTQINWLSIGAVIVASAININAIMHSNTSIMAISLIVALITAALTGSCLWLINHDPSDNSDDGDL